jgi:hypothetical protein
MPAVKRPAVKTKNLTWRGLWGWGTELSSAHCRCCRRQGIPTEAFFGVAFGPGLGTIIGTKPRDEAFRRRVARAAQRHYETAHAGHPMLRHAPWIRE